jgi:hypothetical protein
MTVTKPTTPISKPPTSSKQVKSYQQYVEDLPKMIEQLTNNQATCMRLMIAVNNAPKGK